MSDATTGQPPASKGTLVVLDDEKSVSLLVSNALRLRGFQVISLTDPQQLLPTLAASPVTVLVTDIMMPVLDGVELCRQVRAAGYTKLAILALTAKRLSVDERSTLQSLGVEIMTKPFSPNAFAAKVTAMVTLASAPAVAPPAPSASE